MLKQNDFYIIKILRERARKREGEREIEREKEKMAIAYPVIDRERNGTGIRIKSNLHLLDVHQSPMYTKLSTALTDLAFHNV